MQLGKLCRKFARTVFRTLSPPVVAHTGVLPNDADQFRALRCTQFRYSVESVQRIDYSRSFLDHHRPLFGAVMGSTTYSAVSDAGLEPWHVSMGVNALCERLVACSPADLGWESPTN